MTLVTVKDDYVQSGFSWSLWVQQLVNILERPLFGMGLLICLLPLFTQTSGVVGPLLSVYPTRVLSRLSYAMYLVHFIVIMYGTNSAR